MIIICIDFPSAIFQHPGANEEGLIFILNQAKKFPGVERFWFTFMRPVVALSVPSLIKSLATTHAPKPINGTYGLVLPWLGEVHDWFAVAMYNCSNSWGGIFLVFP